MTRTVPGSGASIRPVFNSVYGVKDVIVTAPGSGYSAADPPKLTIGNCGTPIRDAVLAANIADNGEILSVDVIDPGEGYNPLRLIIESDEDNIVQADANIILNESDIIDQQGNIIAPAGSINYIQVTRPGDGYFSASARLEGGGGSGAELVPTVGQVTGLSVENNGRSYTAEDITLVISGGGGQNATGVCEVNQFGTVESITISNPGEFFETPPLIQLIGGGGSGAQAEAEINLGKITAINILNPGGGYTSPPSVIFTRDTNLIRTQRNRTSLVSAFFEITALIRNATATDSTIYVETTDAFPGSGKFQIGREIVRYTGKTPISFTGCDRGINFRYDQRVILDALADDPVTGISGYNFTVSDRVRRVQEDKTNKVAIVYDWRPETKELFLIFQVDELAFIDGGRSNERTAVIQFIGGTASSTETGEAPHVLIDDETSSIVTFESPLGVLEGKRFEDDDELQGAGDGIPDLVNTGTDYENEISLDGGIASSLYGIEETVGGQNTTLFQQADQLYDSSLVPLTASVQQAGALDDGIEHTSLSTIKLRNVQNAYTVGETVTGSTTGVTAIVVEAQSAVDDFGYVFLKVQTITNSGSNYKFTTSDTLNGGSSGANGVFVSQEYTNLVRKEQE
tara:strand:- start:20991 stop:22874 length:1884 start_codon:yes stop_codon:yes gene_type:complete